MRAKTETQEERKLDLSIVIPCRVDGEDMTGLCQRCVNTIKNNIDAEKHLKRVEVILVDDASPMGDLKTLDTTGIPNFTYIRNKERRGIGGSRNVGLDASKGRYVHYLDADDYVANDYLQSLLGHFDKDKQDGKDIQLYLIAFMITRLDEKGNKSVSQNQLKIPNYAYSPCASWCKVTRRDKCVRHPEVIYLEDVEHNFLQLDAPDDASNVSILNELAYLCYDNTRPTAYTRTADFLQTNHFTMEQLATSNILDQKKLKDRAISDLLRAVAGLYDMRNALKHENVRKACLERFNIIWNKILTNNYTH